MDDVQVTLLSRTHENMVSWYIIIVICRYIIWHITVCVTISMTSSWRTILTLTELRSSLSNRRHHWIYITRHSWRGIHLRSDGCVSCKLNSYLINKCQTQCLNVWIDFTLRWIILIRLKFSGENMKKKWNIKYICLYYHNWFITIFYFPIMEIFRTIYDPILKGRYNLCYDYW